MDILAPIFLSFFVDFLVTTSQNQTGAVAQPNHRSSEERTRRSSGVRCCNCSLAFSPLSRMLGLEATEIQLVRVPSEQNNGTHGGGAVGEIQRLDYLSAGDAANLPPLAAQSQWYGVQTRSRHEKKLLLHLDYSGFTSFLPLLNRISDWSDRKHLVQEPMFPGYVFVRMVWSPEIRNLVLRQSGAVALVGVRGVGTPIPEKQIEDIKTLLACNVEWKHSPFLRTGDRVRVRSGALDGMEGILLRENQDKSLVISIDAIQRSLSIRVTGYALEKI